jgi:predicted transposase/invertase (TIGR01784 family)
MYTEQISSGLDYWKLQRAISILIADFRLIKENGRPHHKFLFRDQEAKVNIPESLEIRTLELPKLPRESDGTRLWLWMRFLSSKTAAEFEEIAGKDALMAKVVGTLMELSQDEENRMLAEAREKERRDWASRMRGSRLDGLAEGEAKGRAEGRAEGERRKATVFIQNSLRKGMSLADIADITELSLDEVKRLAAIEDAVPPERR